MYCLPANRHLPNNMHIWSTFIQVIAPEVRPRGIAQFPTEDLEYYPTMVYRLPYWRSRPRQQYHHSS